MQKTTGHTVAYLSVWQISRVFNDHNSVNKRYIKIPHYTLSSVKEDRDGSSSSSLISPFRTLFSLSYPLVIAWYDIRLIRNLAVSVKESLYLPEPVTLLPFKMAPDRPAAYVNQLNSRTHLRGKHVDCVQYSFQPVFCHKRESTSLGAPSFLSIHGSDASLLCLFVFIFIHNH